MMISDIKSRPVYRDLAPEPAASGHLLVPWSSAYYRGKYEIDPLNLPANVQSPSVEQRVAVRRGSGYLLEFPLARVIAASRAPSSVNSTRRTVRRNSGI